MAREDTKGAWKLTEFIWKDKTAWNISKLGKFYFKNFVISIFLVHFVVLYISVNSYLFSPTPQATGLEHSPVPVLVITEKKEKGGGGGRVIA